MSNCTVCGKPLLQHDGFCLDKEQKMKIVRVTLKVGTESFYFDRAYDPEQDNFKNCDTALKFLSDLYEQQKVIAVMHMGNGIMREANKELVHDPYGNATPAMLNLAVIPFIDLENAGVYDTE
jgi:hypothetical protein